MDGVLFSYHSSPIVKDLRLKIEELTLGTEISRRLSTGRVGGIRDNGDSCESRLLGWVRVLVSQIWYLGFTVYLVLVDEMKSVLCRKSVLILVLTSDPDLFLFFVGFPKVDVMSCLRMSFYLQKLTSMDTKNVVLLSF